MAQTKHNHFKRKKGIIVKKYWTKSKTETQKSKHAFLVSCQTTLQITSFFQFIDCNTLLCLELVPCQSSAFLLRYPKILASQTQYRVHPHSLAKGLSGHAILTWPQGLFLATAGDSTTPFSCP